MKIHNIHLMLKFKIIEKSIYTYMEMHHIEKIMIKIY